MSSPEFDSHAVTVDVQSRVQLSPGHPPVQHRSRRILYYRYVYNIEKRHKFKKIGTIDITAILKITDIMNITVSKFTMYITISQTDFSNITGILGHHSCLHLHQVQEYTHH